VAHKDFLWHIAKNETTQQIITQNRERNIYTIQIHNKIYIPELSPTFCAPSPKGSTSTKWLGRDCGCLWSPDTRNPGNQIISAGLSTQLYQK